jgi:hypothetical protein
MSDDFTRTIENLGKAIDGGGVATIVVGIVVATVVLALRHRESRRVFASTARA